MDGAPVEITAGEISQAEAARKWRVDVSTVIGIRRTVKDAAQLRWPASPGARAASSRPPRPVERIGATTNSSDGRQFPAFSAREVPDPARGRSVGWKSSRRDALLPKLSFHGFEPL
jgi:hypothetical protein